jgi:hypothetical protein
MILWPKFSFHLMQLSCLSFISYTAKIEKGIWSLITNRTRFSLLFTDSLSGHVPDLKDKSCIHLEKQTKASISESPLAKSRVEPRISRILMKSVPRRHQQNTEQNHNTKAANKFEKVAKCKYLWRILPSQSVLTKKFRAGQIWGKACYHNVK